MTIKQISGIRDSKDYRLEIELRKGKRRILIRDTISAYLFLFPFLVVYLLFLVYPVLNGFYISLWDWELIGDYRKFIGIGNFQTMFSDSFFWSSLWHTVYFVLLSTPLIVLVGLLFAVALNRAWRGVKVFRTIIFAPNVLSTSVVALIWVMVLSPSQGLLAQFLSYFHIPAIHWLTDTKLAMPAIAITTMWWTVGFNMVLFLAGLQDIPAELYEAAKLDGAGSWALFRYVTIPNLRRTIMLVLVLQAVASFQIFGQVYLMTRGGPANSTRVLVQYIYEKGFREWRLGYASAMSVVLLVVMFATSLLQLKFTSKES